MHRSMGILLGLVTLTTTARADIFDRYTNPILQKAPETQGLQPLKALTPELLGNHDRVLPGITSAFLIVHTNGDRWCKLLVQAARQKVPGRDPVPALLIDRFTTFREGTERTVQATSQNLLLFDGFHLNLDLGAVVPEQLGADLRVKLVGEQPLLEPVGKAEIFLATKPLPLPQLTKVERMTPGQPFESRFLAGTWKLHDDGRRSGKLVLMVGAEGEISGSYYSAKDGQKYEVSGKVGPARHAFQLTIKFPRVEEHLQGWVFTADAGALAGTARMVDREAGFYAIRSEED